MRSSQKSRSIFVGRDRGNATGRRVRSTPSGRTGRSVLRVCHFVAYGLEFRTSCPRTRITVPAAVHEDWLRTKSGRTLSYIQISRSEPFFSVYRVFIHVMILHGLIGISISRRNGKIMSKTISCLRFVQRTCLLSNRVQSNDRWAYTRKIWIVAIRNWVIKVYMRFRIRSDVSAARKAIYRTILAGFVLGARDESIDKRVYDPRASKRQDEREVSDKLITHA